MLTLKIKKLANESVHKNHWKKCCFFNFKHSLEYDYVEKKKPNNTENL